MQRISHCNDKNYSSAVMLCLHSNSSSLPPPPPTLRLQCSSNLCPGPVLLHADCYDKLENLLVQAVFSSKNFKNWTEYQVTPVMPFCDTHRICFRYELTYGTERRRSMT